MFEVSSLSHFGVKGMHWGVRRTASSSSVSDDHARASEVRSKIKANDGIKSISNRELEDLIRRIQLEKQYNTLNPSSFKKATKFIGEILSVGNTVNQAVSFVNSPSGKLLRESLMKR
jgi:hypothetical protein